MFQVLCLEAHIEWLMEDGGGVGSGWGRGFFGGVGGGGSLFGGVSGCPPLLLLSSPGGFFLGEDVELS